jgi:anti-sigma regulatory factor (Ser/Thr protein kinase)
MSTMAPPRPSELRLCRIRLSAGPAAAATACRQVEAPIAARDIQVDQGVAVLLISELVTNATRHGSSGTITPAVSFSNDQLRVDVHDTSGAMPALVDPPAGAEHGRGLLLIDALSAEWGLYPTHTGKAVVLSRREAQGTLASAGSTPPPGGRPSSWGW